MNKLGKDIVKFRLIILLVFVAVIVLSAILLPNMIEKVNYDLTSYLPDGYETKDGYTFLSETFQIHGDVEIGLETTRGKIASAADKIYALEGVTGAVWASSLEMLLQFGVYDFSSTEFGELYSVLTDAPVPVGFDENNKPYYSVSTDGEGNKTYVYDTAENHTWALLVTLKYPPSSQQAIKIFGEIKNILIEEVGDGNYAMSGMTEQANALYETVFDEIWKYALIAGVVVIIILIFTTNSLIEPLVLILTMAISIIINLGTNAIFKETSIITFACGAILQLGLSMDYAIFLLHQYRDELRTTIDPKAALAAAIPKSVRAVASSALTTICGFLALLCMQFTIGFDLGLTLAKGIVCSLLTVLLLQPCLMLFLNKVHLKTQHKCLDLHFKAPIKRSIRDRKWVAAAFAVLFIPALYVANFCLHYNYVKFMPESTDTSDKYILAKQLGNQVMIVVPVQYEDADDRNVFLVDENYEFVQKLNEYNTLEENMVTVVKDGKEVKEERLAFMLGMFIMFPEDASITITVPDDSPIFSGQVLENLTMEDILSYIDILQNSDVQIEGMEMLSSYISGGYTMYTVGINSAIDNESELSFEILDDIKAMANDVFGFTGKRCYFTGYTQGAYDFAAITPGDFALVSAISIVAILLILIFTLGGIKFPVLLVALIEFGIWLNLAMQFVFSGGGINFMSYLIITAVQLGATVDYAILITTKYRALRKRFEPRQAAYQATNSSVMSVLTSALIMAGACFSVFGVSSNLIIKEMTFLIARGALVSAILVIFVLPALLVVCDKPLGTELHLPRTPKLRPVNKKRHKKYVPVLSTATVAAADEPALPETANVCKQKSDGKNGGKSET